MTRNDVRMVLHSYRWATSGETLVVTWKEAEALRKFGIESGYVTLDRVGP